ncbi:MAG: ThuA domain-containing protein [Planctomycetaceae bacterium]|nr:ThuA domain-containing protein [Planctomycetaceae bacterium]
MQFVDALLLLVMCAAPAFSAEEGQPKRLLLISQGPDGHPWNTHEFRAGVRILHRLLADMPGLEVSTVDAEDDQRDIPKLVDAADGVVLFVSQGSEWVGSNPERLAAFERLAARKGGITALHWAVGAKDPRYIDVAKNLWGGCHGGPDRKYVVDQRTLEPNREHPITAGLEALTIRDEWYYTLKFASEGTVTPLWTTTIDDAPQAVSWAWERPNGGRSFGFVGLHFHENWGEETYRRFVSRGVLWTMGLEEPKEGLSLEIDRNDIEEPRPKPVGKG